MENWSLEPEVLKVYAKHYKTGEVIPAALVEKIKKAEQFNQGFITVEYLAASLLDMDWHTLTAAEEKDTTAFEQASMEQDPEPAADPAAVPEHVLQPHLSAATRRVTTLHLERGAGQGRVRGVQGERASSTSRPPRRSAPCSRTAAPRTPMAAYKKFRGREPSVEPLLKARGLK